MKKKAILITIYEPGSSHGNRLQHYALQTVLEGLGLQTESVRFPAEQLNGKAQLKYQLQRLSGYRLPGDRIYWQYRFPQLAAFEQFNRRYIHTREIRRADRLPAADFYVLGSDQVWNTAWWDAGGQKADLFLLAAAPPEKRICYSPAFGTDTLDPVWHTRFAEELTRFPQLSVREAAGARIIQNLTGRTAQVTPDPALLLTAEEWRALSRQPQGLPGTGPWILSYFLGPRPARAEQDLTTAAARTGATVLEPGSPAQPVLSAAGPAEFLWLTDHARLILTDSFHACIFAFLFGRPFLLYAREGRETGLFSRLDTLLNTFGLQRKFTGSGLENDPLECSYEDSCRRLEAERVRALQFLRTSLHLPDGTQAERTENR